MGNALATVTGGSDKSQNGKGSGVGIAANAKICGSIPSSTLPIRSFGANFSFPLCSNPFKGLCEGGAAAVPQGGHPFLKNPDRILVPGVLDDIDYSCGLPSELRSVPPRCFCQPLMLRCVRAVLSNCKLGGRRRSLEDMLQMGGGGDHPGKRLVIVFNIVLFWKLKTAEKPHHRFCIERHGADIAKGH